MKVKGRRDLGNKSLNSINELMMNIRLFVRNLHPYWLVYKKGICTKGLFFDKISFLRMSKILEDLCLHKINLTSPSNITDCYFNTLYNVIFWAATPWCWLVLADSGDDFKKKYHLLDHGWCRPLAKTNLHHGLAAQTLMACVLQNRFPVTTKHTSRF